MSRHLMLLPTLACPASCEYCFGPHEDGPTMSRETLEAVVDWQLGLDGTDRLEITFHGGEPLLPGPDFYRVALPLLSDGLRSRRPRFALQSNLWLLSDELCELFREHDVSLGTSLDGPETINDAQRGAGYFRRTMAGIERARSHGLSVGCICTFSAASVARADEVFDFFAAEGLGFTVHAAVPSLRDPAVSTWALPPEAHGELLVELLERYLANLEKVRIGTLDSLCRSVSARQGGICTFGDCLGQYLAVGPTGEIHPCQRFTGMAGYELANVHDRPTAETLSSSPAWRKLQNRQERIEQECGDCPHLALCRGGCPYDALAASAAGSRAPPRDPYCASYRRIFDQITERALEEVFSEENLDAVVARPDPDAGLFRHGALLGLMRGAPHPVETANQAKRALAAVALAETGSPAEASRRLERVGLPGAGRAEGWVKALHERLVAPVTGLNKLYLPVTFACPLQCSHCCAQAGPDRDGTMPVERVVRACREAATLGFRQAVITGGEPLVHGQRDALLDALGDLRAEVKPLRVVLRTSLSLPLGEALLRRVGRGADEVVVSVDGDRDSHDARRGAGSYETVVANLQTLLGSDCEAEVSIASVLPLETANGPPGEAVRALARELGIRRTRFRPLLPLGRAQGLEPDVLPAASWGRLDRREMLSYGFVPTASCGIGQNLRVEPDGRAYPCHAWCGKGWLLGEIDSEEGLAGVLASDGFADLGRHTVDTNRACRACALRYLCGGACRAWSPRAEGTDLDTPPIDCSALYERACAVLNGALEHLDIPLEQWLAAGLPHPGQEREVADTVLLTSVRTT